MRPTRTQAANWRSLPKQPIKSGDAVYSRILDEHFFPFNEEEFRELLQCELEHKEQWNQHSLREQINSPISFLCEVYQLVLCKESGPPKFSMVSLLAGYLSADAPLPDGALELEERVNDWLINQPDETWGVVPANIAWNGEFADAR